MRNKYIIHTQPARISDHEIEKYQDFSRVLAESKTGKNIHLSTRSLISIGITAVMIALVIWWLSGYREPVQEPLNSEVSETPSNVSEQQETPGKQNNEVIPDHEIDSESEPESNPERAEVQPEIERKAPLKQTEAVKEEPSREEIIFLKAEPVNGMAGLYEYFENELVYPEEGLKDKISGTTLITFTINVNGRAEDIEIERSLGEAFDKEAIRLISEMPDWNPASVNGTPVKSKISIPINFSVR